MPCRHVVLDEADQMLERGFAETVEEILSASFQEGTVGGWSKHPWVIAFQDYSPGIGTNKLVPPTTRK